MTDAGGNDLLKVDHKGRISVVAVFPPRPVAAPDGTMVPMQAVLGHHAAYITNNSILSGAGQVVKVAI